MKFTERFKTKEEMKKYVLSRIAELYKEFAFYEENIDEDTIDSRSKVKKLLDDDEFLHDYCRLIYEDDEDEHLYTDFDSEKHIRAQDRRAMKIMAKYGLPCIEY